MGILARSCLVEILVQGTEQRHANCSGQGVLKEAEVREAMREVWMRRAYDCLELPAGFSLCLCRLPA